MLKVILISVILLLLAFAGMGIKMLFDKIAEFRGGSCSASTPELEKQGITCGCGSDGCISDK